MTSLSIANYGNDSYTAKTTPNGVTLQNSNGTVVQPIETVKRDVYTPCTENQSDGNTYCIKAVKLLFEKNAEIEARLAKRQENANAIAEHTQKTGNEVQIAYDYYYQDTATGNVINHRDWPGNYMTPTESGKFFVKATVYEINFNAPNDKGKTIAVYEGEYDPATNRGLVTYDFKNQSFISREDWWGDDRPSIQTLFLNAYAEHGDMKEVMHNALFSSVPK